MLFLVPSASEKKRSPGSLLFLLFSLIFFEAGNKTSIDLLQLVHKFGLLEI